MNITYKISFKWKAQGTQKDVNATFYVGLSKNPDGSQSAFKYVERNNSLKLITTIEKGTYDQKEWNNETVEYTVPANADLENYPNLVLYTDDPSGGTISYYFDDITVTSLAKYTETVYADNDFSTADVNVTQSSAYKYRGASFVGTDPADSNNKVVVNKAGTKDLGVIYLNDAYATNLPDKFVNVTAGTTYTIRFKWKYDGTQDSASTKIGVGLAQTPLNGDDGKKFSPPNEILDQYRKQDITEVKTGTYENIKWKEETVEYTVPADADLTTYPNLVLYTQNTGSGMNISYYFDDISVKSISKIESERFFDEKIVDTDFSTANDGVLTQSSVSQYRGSSFVGIDPADNNNKVVVNRAGTRDMGAIYLNDAYKTNCPTDFIAATAGTTYTIRFKWKYDGTQDTASTKIGVGLAKKPYEGASGYIFPEISSKQELTEVKQGTYENVEWKEETVKYTVPAGADLVNYPNLVLYTENTGRGNNISYYFDDITVTTAAAATVHFNYEGNAASNFAAVEKTVYFEDGTILDYQPSELPVGVKWYADDQYTEEYDFTKDYTEYMDITLYGVSQYVKGDVNANGSIDAQDMVLLRKHLLGIITGKNRFYDINNDNYIDIRDLVSLKKCSSESE